MRHLRVDDPDHDPTFSRMPDRFPFNRRIAHLRRFLAFGRQLNGMLWVPGLRPDTGFTRRSQSRPSTWGDRVSGVTWAGPDTGRLWFWDDRATTRANSSESRFANEHDIL